MALKGTLKDFSLADIFQLIGIQRKTGVLTLKSDTDVVTVSFLSGAVVAADSLHKNLEDRLGTVLVKSGRMTQAQLQEALKVQKNTLQRLGYVLIAEKFISQDDLRQALQLQVTQIVYRLFRWRDGDYHFSQEEGLNYDRENFVPIPAQNVLMEGIRMIDEWPIIEKRIPNFDMVFDKADPSRELQESAEEATDAAAIDAVFDEEIAEATKKEPPPADADGPALVSREQLQVYELVDGRSTVQELVERTRLGEFDTCRVLYELLELELLREARLVPVDTALAGVARRSSRFLARFGLAVLVLVAGGSVASMSFNPLNMLPLPFNESPTVDSFKRVLSRNRLERIDHALYLYFLKHHSFAPNLTILIDEGYITAEVVTDPWNQFYGYEPMGEGYRIFGYDNGGVEDSTLALTRRFPTGILPGEASRRR